MTRSMSIRGGGAPEYASAIFGGPSEQHARGDGTNIIAMNDPMKVWKGGSAAQDLTRALKSAKQEITNIGKAAKAAIKEAKMGSATKTRKVKKMAEPSSMDMDMEGSMDKDMEGSMGKEPMDMDMEGSMDKEPMDMGKEPMDMDKEESMGKDEEENPKEEMNPEGMESPMESMKKGGIESGKDGVPSKEQKKEAVERMMKEMEEAAAAAKEAAAAAKEAAAAAAKKGGNLLGTVAVPLGLLAANTLYKPMHGIKSIRKSRGRVNKYKKQSKRRRY